MMKIVNVPSKGQGDLYLITDQDNIGEMYIDYPRSFVNIVYKSKSGKRNPVYYITTNQLKNEEDQIYISPQIPFRHEPRIFVESSVKIEGFEEVEENIYSGFLEDWLEYLREGNLEELRKELIDHGYIM